MEKEIGRDTWSVVLACALGAFIGALSALEIAAKLQYGRYLWIFGALLGGVVAWCAVDLKQLCAGVARSYQVSKANVAKMTRWKPNKAYWKATVAMTAGFGAVGTSALLLALVIKFFVEVERPYLSVLHSSFVAFYLPSFSVTVACMLLMVKIPLDMMGDEEKDLSSSAEVGWLMFKYSNPIILPFLAMYGFLLGVCFFVDLLRYGPKVEEAIITFFHFLGKVGKEIGRFFVRSFIYIHSERRTICFVDATLGALIGFFLGSAVTGAAIGAVFGGINYEIVSIRWLKIVPARAK